MVSIHRATTLLLALFFATGLADEASPSAAAPIDDGPVPDDLNGSNFTYPWPIKLYRFASQQQQDLEMAFMDVEPTAEPNGRVAVLLHGRNFCGPTWEGTARELLAAGWRVILPDQVGFCKSSKPLAYQFSLQQLVTNTNNLLQALGIDKVTVIGHSMGGMMTVRYGLMFPSVTERLVLVNPIGLEDWKAKGVPYRPPEANYDAEAAATYESVRRYEQATYYVGQWDDAYDVWVNMLLGVYYGSKREEYLACQARVVDMVLTQEVVYEFPLLKPPTLLLIGEKDTTAIGAAWSPPEVAETLGHYDVLGEKAAAAMPNATLIEFPELGHAPQIQAPEAFHKELLGWLTSAIN